MIANTYLAENPTSAGARLRPAGFGDFVTVARFHWRVGLGAFLAVFLLAVALSFFVKPAAVSHARLLVLYGSEYFYRPTAGQTGGGVALDRNEIMLGELEVLQSITLARETLQTVGVDRVYPGTPTNDETALSRAAIRLAKDLNLTIVPQSSVLSLSFRGHDPDISVEVLRTLIDRYLAYRTVVFQRGSTIAARGDQLTFQSRLNHAEDALASFAESHGIADVDLQINLALQRQARNTEAREAAVQAINETSATLAMIEEQLLHIPPTLETSADSDRSRTAQTLSENLAKLQVTRRDLVARYPTSVRLAQDLDREIGSVQAQIEEMPPLEDSVIRHGVNSVYQDAQLQKVRLSARLAGLKAKAAQLDATAAAMDAQILELNKSARQYRDLLRERDLLEESYRTMVRSDEESQISDAAERGRSTNVRVVQQPERPLLSSSTRVILIFAGFMVGLIAALAALAVANSLRQVFVIERDVALALDLPVLVSAARRSDRSQSGWLTALVRGLRRRTRDLSSQTVPAGGMAAATVGDRSVSTRIISGK